MFRLRNPVQRYAWGSTERLARFLGEDPDGTPQAELWLGAHRAAPSFVDIDGAWAPLPAVLAADPAAMLGPAVVARFGAELPFLFKVLAAAEPLSLQVHPDAAQARAGFAREEAAGLALDDPRRSYRDPNHKPELLCALDHFDVLSGFRPAAALAGVLDAFGLGPAWTDLARTTSTGRVCAALWDLTPADQQAVAAAVARAAGAGGGEPSEAVRRLPRELDLVRRAVRSHGAEIGVVIALCLNRLRLIAGQAMFAPAGRLHAYLEGFGVELMANSDNVVRGGLTAKTVDVAELRRLLSETAGAGHENPAPLEPQLDEVTGESRFAVMAEEFALSSFLLEGDRVAVTSPGPEILLCVDGALDVHAPGGATFALERGGSLFVPAATAGYELRGVGTLYRARVGLHAVDQR